MALLAAKDLHASYGLTRVLHGISFSMEKGTITTLLGANGAGKTTTLKAISNLLAAERGAVTKGAILFRGTRVDRLTPAELVSRGVVQVMEGRHCFPHLTVEDNLLTGAFTRKGSRAELKRDLERVYGYFPRLKERHSQQAGTLSGGEQQMLAVGRAMMLRPRLMLLDEPSFGLAPLIVEELFGILRTMNKQEKVSMLLVEQNAALALDLADHAYLMETGRLVMSGPARELRDDENIRKAYLGY
jgi:branched-chain amino acid transport system ATP-binding protein